MLVTHTHIYKMFKLNHTFYSQLGLFGFMLLSYHGNEVVKLDNFRQKWLVSGF